MLKKLALLLGIKLTYKSSRKAKERGQQFGRKPLRKKMIQEIHNRKEKGQTVIEMATAMNIGTSTIYKYLKVN